MTTRQATWRFKIGDDEVTGLPAAIIICGFLAIIFMSGFALGAILT